MLIAQEKRKENIAEYLLYMFQIEDLIRAYDFDINRIESELISRYDQSYEFKRELREWYGALISMMTESKCEKSGHIPLVETLIKDVNDLHHTLLGGKAEKEYKELHSRVNSALAELKLRGGDTEMSDIKASLNGLYGYLMLKIQNKTINPETKIAFEHISSMMAVLSQRFKEVEKGHNEA